MSASIPTYNWCQFVPARGPSGTNHLAPEGCLYCPKHTILMRQRNAKQLQKDAEEQEKQRLEVLRLKRAAIDHFRMQARRNESLMADEEATEADFQAMPDSFKRNLSSSLFSSPVKPPAQSSISSRLRSHDPQPSSSKPDSTSRSRESRHSLRQPSRSPSRSPSPPPRSGNVSRGPPSRSSSRRSSRKPSRSPSPDVRDSYRRSSRHSSRQSSRKASRDPSPDSRRSSRHSSCYSSRAVSASPSPPRSRPSHSSPSADAFVDELTERLSDLNM